MIIWDPEVVLSTTMEIIYSARLGNLNIYNDDAPHFHITGEMHGVRVPVWHLNRIAFYVDRRVPDVGT